MQNAIELNAVKKQLGNFTLGPISLSVPKGCIVGYIGENGAGKSTTIKLMLGLLRADEGEIKLLGNNIKDFTPEMKKDIGYVFDNLYIPQEMNLKNAISFHEKLYGSAWDSKTCNSFVDRFNLPHNKEITHFSRGMKMQLGLTFALSHGAKLLLLDEPTSGLDPVIRDDVLDILLEYIQDENNTVLISSHILSDLEKAADYIAFIHKGQLLFMEQKDELVESCGILSLSSEQARDIDPSAIIGKREHKFGVELLVRRSLVPENMDMDKVSIEDIMIYMIKEDRQ
ncbi:MAG: ABC transporter ATP-binding protein [Christensenellaceae bacterium]|nr:ABC transporter ATP-binding protein [Christensenellaceae bacterium]